MTNPARPDTRRHGLLRATAFFCLVGLAAGPGNAEDPATEWHLAVNLAGDFSGVREVGFNLADVGSPSMLDKLPEGMRGVLWLGNGYNLSCEWRLSDAEVETAVAAVRDHLKFSGIYYISDEPHPTNCPDAPEKVTERSELIRSLDPGARTLILVQNGSKGPEEFHQLAGSANLIGVLPYPCNYKNIEQGCDLQALRARIKAAMEAVGPERLVPVFQTFGQDCAEVAEPYYRMPSVVEAKRMLAVWDELLPRDRRPLDIAYSWGARPTNACPSLKMANGVEYPDLLALYTDYFAGRADVGLAVARDD